MSKPCTIRILDEVTCVIVGLDDSHFKYFNKIYSPFKEGYFHSLKYQMGHWDGRISFFTKGGRTYTKLLPDIIPQIYKWGYKPKLIDNRSPINLTLPPIDEDIFKDSGITLGEHQVKGANAILENQGGIVVAGTGAGKSILCAALAKTYSEQKLKVVMIVPNSDLVTQGVGDFKQVGLDVGEYSGDIKDLNHPIIISTWQALQNNTSLMGMFHVAIVDECHGTKGEVIKSLINDHGSHLFVRIGVTGTLPKDDVDAMSVRVTLGDPVFTITSKELIDKGWLAKVNIHMIELEEDYKTEYKEFKIKFPEESKNMTYAKYLEHIFPDFNSEKAHLGSTKDRTDFIAALIYMKSMERKGNSLVLVNSVTAGKKYASLIDGSHFVYGQDKKAARKEIYDLFNTHDNIVVIATSQLASTGLNIPRIFNLFFIDMGKSYIRTIQSVGRGLRKAHDKFSVEVFDIYSNLKYSRQHKNKRVAHYKEAQYEYDIQKFSYKSRI